MILQKQQNKTLEQMHVVADWLEASLLLLAGKSNLSFTPTC
jgi:hypothetical protein